MTEVVLPNKKKYPQVTLIIEYEKENISTTMEDEDNNIDSIINDMNKLTINKQNHISNNIEMETTDTTETNTITQFAFNFILDPPEPRDYKLIDVNSILELPNEYPEEFNDFCLKNGLKPPSITTSNGKALSVMLTCKYFYWNRDTCDHFVKKFNIRTRDSIQLFNKHNQWGIQTNSGTERGKLYIIYPYCLSNKHKMRKNFKFNGTNEEKNKEINKIKSTIQADYIDVPNSLWQLGHKNPGSTDNSTNNLVLQPPIQGKYRDNYIFIDTLTKFPMPKKLENMIENKEIEFTQEQIIHYKEIFNKLFTSI
jgi:hypothetical protein